jgi:hypothetical protein
MRIALLVVGIVVLIGGLGTLGYAYFTASGAQTAWNLFCAPGSLFNGTYDESVCASFLATADRYNQVALWAGIVSIVGLAATIAGAALRGPPAAPAPMPMYAPTPAPPPAPAAWQKSCPQCGRSNPPDNRFCAGCGAALP